MSDTKRRVLAILAILMFTLAILTHFVLLSVDGYATEARAQNEEKP